MKYLILILFLVSGLKAHLQSSLNQRLMLPADRLKYKLDTRDSNQRVHAVYPLVNSGYKLLKSPGNNFFKKSTNYNPNHIGELGGFVFGAYPLLEVTQGMEPNSELSVGADNREQRFTYGGHISVTHGTRFSLEASIWERQINPLSFEERFIAEQDAFPGDSKTEERGTGFITQNWTGNIGYKAGDYFHIELGRGKQFIGDGYRSLMLSDFANQNNYLRITTEFKKVRYTNLFLQGVDIAGADGVEANFKEKYMSIHHLSIQPFSWWNISIFEAVVWQAQDSSFHRGFDVSYLNPIIFYRPVEFELGSPDNVLIGLSSRFDISNAIELYGQLMLDEFKLDEVTARDGWWGNKYAIQAGLNWYEPFQLKNSAFQVEYNRVRPFTFSHSNPVQNYGHYNAPMGHPMGANFHEVIASAYYWKSRLRFEARANFIMTGVAMNENVGSDIFKSNTTRSKDRGYFVVSGDAKNILMLHTKASYLVNSAMRLELFARIGYRKEQVAGSRSYESVFGAVGLSTVLFNEYKDFR